MLRTDMIYPKRGRNRNRAGAVWEDDRVVDAESSSEEGAGLEGEVTQRKSRRRGKRRRKGDQRRR